MDIISRGMVFAAILLLCLVPFIIVLNALAGHTALTSLARRIGLSHEAAADLGRLFAPPTSTSAAISGLGYVLFILGGIAAAATIQDLYERVFELEARGFKNVPHQLAWLAALIGAFLVAGRLGPPLHQHAGPVVLGLFGFVGVGLFWWFSMWLLLAGRMRWRELLPAAIATGICWVGMEAVFALTLSSSIVSDYDKYGAIGIVFAVMSYLIAIGVVIILGAVAGVVWRERKGPHATSGSTSGDLE
jgi:membrane protein